MTEPAIHADLELAAFNTLRLSARAEFFASPESLEEVHQCLAFARARQLPVTILGGGSNVVLRERLPGLVLVPRLLGKSIEASGSESFLVRLAASENWDQAVLWSLQQGASGLENLSWIPGTCGAAPIQNIGAYGVELADRLSALTALHLSSGETHRFSREQCLFRYRDSFFKSEARGQWLVLEIELELSARFEPQLHYADLEKRYQALPPNKRHALGLRELVIALRDSKLPNPAVLPNAGSFFKNPLVPREQADALQQQFPDLPSYPVDNTYTKLAAGWLIEQAGWKGKHLGKVGMHQQQALVLVNEGEPRAERLLAVAEQVRRDVLEQFGVLLEQEPLVVPA